MLKYALAASVACFAMSANAQNQQCGPRLAVIESLSGNYSETRHTLMLGVDRLFEIYANLETGTWTALVTFPDGKSCIAASGTGFELTNDPLVPTGARL